MNIIIVANAQTKGDTLSGADRIFIELAKRWVFKSCRIHVITSEQGYEMCQRSRLENVRYLNASTKYKLPLYLLYIIRMIKGSILAGKISSLNENDVVYSSSDFWPDSIPALVFKLKFRKVKWIAGFYLFAPSLFAKESPYKGLLRLKGLFYYMSQIPVYALVRKHADMVWVTSDPDKGYFRKHLLMNKVVVVRGGVDIKTPFSVPEPVEKQFDAVFIGRFHPQKGVLELIEIWNYVCKQKKDAKLAMIGVSPLEGRVANKIRDYGLNNNIILFGFKDGIEKLRIFKNSRVVVHPAIYDSGGMAACEAMACGLPGVSFDLPALKTYYPKGMLKTPCYDLATFGENIIKLINDEILYKKTARDALEWSREWDWDKTAEELLKKIQRD